MTVVKDSISYQMTSNESSHATLAGAAKGAARQAQQATPDLSGVFDDLAGKVRLSY